MSNAFYRFLNRFTPRSTVKAEPHNAQFDAVEDGFDAVDSQLSRAVKITGLTNGGEVTPTANSFLLLNGSSAPTATQTLTFSPNFGGYRIQNVATGTAGTDATNLNHIQQLISDAAYGSTTTLAVPTVVGQAGKQLHVKSDETGTEWKFAVPQTTGTGESLVSVAGVPTWALGGKNLLYFSSMEWPDIGWTKHASARVGDLNAIFTPGVSDTGTISSGSDVIKPKEDYYVVASSGNTFTASCDAACFSSASLGKVSLFVRFLDFAYSQVGSDSTVSVLTAADSTLRRVSVTATAPSGVAYVICGLKTTSTVTGGGTFLVRNFQLERGSTPSVWSGTRTESYMARFFAKVNNTIDGFGLHYVIADDQAIFLEFATTGATGYSARLKASYGSTTGDGSLDVTCKRAIFSKALGFASVYDNGNTSTAQTIDWYNGQKQKSAITANTTITLTAPDSDIVLDGLRWRGTFSGAGGWTVAFASTATIQWIGNESPTAANGMVSTAGQELEAVFDWDGTRFVGRWTNM